MARTMDPKISSHTMPVFWPGENVTQQRKKKERNIHVLLLSIYCEESNVVKVIKDKIFGKVSPVSQSGYLVKQQSTKVVFVIR